MLNLLRNFYLETDTRQYLMYEWDGKLDKNGNKVKKNERFFRTLESCGNHLLQICVMEKISSPEVTTLRELVSDVASLRLEIAEVFSSLDSL